MDRRRFKPSAEGLEGRALLSLFGGSAYQTSQTNLTTSIQNEPGSIHLKEQRIERLPYYLEQMQPGRALPAPLMSQLQVDMLSVMARLHAPTTPVVEAFNSNLRHTYPHMTVSQPTAQILNHSFMTVLEKAGATPDQVQNLGRDLNDLVRVDVASKNAAILTANDYAIILQTALSVGRPVQTPTAPQLSVNDGQLIGGGKGGVTRITQPTLVGTYTVGASTTGLVQMQIVDVNSGQVLGSAPVQKNGHYDVTLAVPLAPGTYKLSSRAFDQGTHYSAPSRAFTLKVADPQGTTAATATHTVTVTSNGVFGL